MVKGGARERAEERRVGAAVGLGSLGDEAVVFEQGI